MIRQAANWVLLTFGVAWMGGLAVRSPMVGFGIIGLVVLGFLLTKPTWAAVGAVTLLPFQVNVIPGLGLEIGATDLLVVTAVAGWAVADLLRPDAAGSARSVRPVALGLLAYSGAAVLTMVANLSSVGLISAAQRAELVVGGLLVGGGLVKHGKLAVALEGYLVAACVLAVAAVIERGGESALGVQKNPAGGFLSAALILVVVLRPGRRWWVYAPLLAAGTLVVQSRAALVGLIAAAVLTVLVVRRAERGKLAALFASAGVVFYLGYRSLPSSAQERLLNYTGKGEYAVDARESFQADAFDAFRSSPWWGVGIGNYNGGVRFPLIKDPHQVLYLELAEGGVLLTVAFVLLVVVTLVVAFRRIYLTKLAVVALSVQTSTFVHALFDVYWVRGTPVPAFLLLGATLAAVHYARQGDERAAPWIRAVDPASELAAVPELVAAGGHARKA